MTEIGAFYVSLQTDIHVYHPDRVMFDTVIYSPGSDFDTSAGYYRCPINGTYVFMATITTGEQYGSVSYYLKRSGTVHQPKIIPRNPYHSFLSASGFWIFNCAVADEVYLEVSHDNLSGAGQIIKGDGFSTFSGFLLTHEF